MVLEIANCRKHGWETMDILGRSKSWGTKNGRKGWNLPDFYGFCFLRLGDQNRFLGPGNTPCRTSKARHLRAYPHLVIEYNLTWKPIFVFENVDLLLPNQHSPPHRPISSFERKYSAFFASGTTIAPPPFSYQNVMYLFLWFSLYLSLLLVLCLTLFSQHLSFPLPAQLARCPIS